MPNITNLTQDPSSALQVLLSSSATPYHELGARLVTGDGRAFRYVEVGASALVPGNLYQGAAEDTTLEALSVSATAIGATSVTTTSTVTLTANQLANGYLVVTQTPGQGYMYRIASHPAVTSGVVTLQLADPIQVALTTSSKVDLVPNPYQNIEIWDHTSTDNMPVGVAVYPVAASQYGWIQVSGPASVLVDAGALTVGNIVVASDDTDGAVGPFETDALTGIVGTAITGVAAADYGLVNLNIS